jgi:RNA polymerase sigma-70 factor (ECF subfamily)
MISWGQYDWWSKACQTRRCDVTSCQPGKLAYNHFVNRSLLGLPVWKQATSPPAKLNGFVTTHWSVVLRAGQTTSHQSSQALEELCQSYWRPLYAFVRRQGHAPEDAQDLTQAFFERFLQQKYISLADPGRGKFRTFLLRSLEHFLINEWTRERALKRGGAYQFISLQEREAEEQYLLDRPGNLTPAQIFERRWALTLLHQVLSRLRAEFCDSDKSDLFDALKGFVFGEQNETSYVQIGSRFGMAEGAVKTAVHRMRQRYRELLRAEVANTIETPAEVDAELKYLAMILRGES